VATISEFLGALWSWIVAALVSVGLMTAPGPPAFQGYIEGEFVLVASPVGGALVTLAVARGATVAAGAPLFALEHAAERAQRDEAAARLQQAEARLDDINKGRRQPEIDVIAAQRNQAEAQMRLALIQVERQQRLVGSSAFVQARLDEARAAHDQWRARVDELDAQLRVAQMRGREDEVRAVTAEAQAARAALAQAQWRLDQKTVAAPAAGLVQDTLFQNGEMVPAGAAVVSILPAENRKIRFFVPQAMLARFAVGTPVTVRCDGCRAAVPARVVFVAAQAEYTPPVLYNRDSRTRLVFLVEARPEASAETLNVGQPVDVTAAR
jgi:HlyD family secretion protein